MNKAYLENLIVNFRNGNVVNITKALKLEDLLYKDENNFTLLEYMLLNDYSYNYSFINGIKDNIETIKLFCKYNKENVLVGINTPSLLLQIEENQTLIEYLIDTNKIDNVFINNLKYDKKLVDILMTRRRYDLIKKLVISESELFFSDNLILKHLIESGAIDYIEFPEIIYHEDILDILNKYDKTKFIEKINFSENLLLNDKKNPLIKRILDLGYYPKISHCSFKTLEYLYKTNRADALIKYFDDANNIFDLFRNIYNNKRLTIIDYLLEFDRKEMSLNFKELGLNVYDHLDEVDLVSIYIKFSIYKKLDYLDRLSKENFLKANKKKHCLLDSFVFSNLEETFKILKYYNLNKDVDIIMYFKLNGIDINSSDIDFSIFNNEYSNVPIIEQNEEIRDSVDLEYLGEENVYLLAELEEVLLQNSDKELVDIIILLYSKELSKGNNSVLIEINKLIEIKKKHPEFVITRDSSAFFNYRTGLHLVNNEINILSHELGHVLHYYLADDRTPYEFPLLIEKLRSDDILLKKVEIFSKNMLILENTIEEKVYKGYDEWAQEYYSESKKEEAKSYVETSKEEKIEYYVNLGYTREELEFILSDSYTFEQYMDCHRRIECSERLNNIMSVSYSEVQAISDIIDAIYGGAYYNSRLRSLSGKIIKGTFGHGMIYYYSMDTIFQEIFANYCLLLKSNRREKSISILKDIIGEELVDLLDRFYNEELLNSPKYEKESKVL